MKKRIYFIISGVIQILTSIYSMTRANEFVEALIGSTETFPDAMKERVNSLYQNSGTIFIYIIATICILLNLYIIYIACKGKLLKKKEAVIVCSILSLFTANIEIIELLAIVNIIVIASSKRINPEDFPDKNRKLIPVLEKEEVDKKKVIMAIVLLLVYFSDIIWSGLVPEGSIRLVVQGMFYLLMIVLSIWFFKDTFKRDFKAFKNNFLAYVRYILPKLGIFYLIYLLVSLVCIAITNSTAANQDAIESLPIWFSLPLAVIYAPIVEETLFRGCIRRFIKSDKVYIVVSGIIFGLLHTIFSETTIFRTIVLALPYGVMGAYLAYIYTKTNNMFSNISSHAFNNIIAMIFTILIMGF